MKKFFALIISLIIILTCFTACKSKLQGGGIITDAANQNYAAVTNEDGGIVRDGSGNLIVLVTDENGKNVKDENGEYETKPVALKHALVVGNRIECPKFALTIPKGWSDKLSYSDLIISRDGTKDVVKISVYDDRTLNEELQEKLSVITEIKSQFPGTVSDSKEVQITDKITGDFFYAFVEDTGSRDEDLNVLSSYLGYIVFQKSTSIYTCMITSDRDVTEQIDEITEILGTIEFMY